MNRGARHQPTYLDDLDRLRFLAGLADVVERLGVEIHAYCLMDNHFHLLVRTPEPCLGKAMQQLIGPYTQCFNRRYGGDGALFRGRFNSVLVERDPYLQWVSRYIHHNPVAASMAETPESYEWSSCRFFVGDDPPPRWLRTSETLGMCGGPASYRRFLGPTHHGPVRTLYESEHGPPPVLGSPRFVADVTDRGHVGSPSPLVTRRAGVRPPQPRPEGEVEVRGV